MLDCWIKQLSSEHIVEILLFYLLSKSIGIYSKIPADVTP